MSSLLSAQMVRTTMFVPAANVDRKEDVLLVIDTPRTTFPRGHDFQNTQQPLVKFL